MNPYLHARRLARKLRKRFSHVHAPWRGSTSSPFNQRQYTRYDEYIKHQRSKLREIVKNWLPRYDIEFREVLRERLRRHAFLHRGTTVLCLAARIGTEVKAFADLGCFAVGIDLNPGTENRHVLYGDFHHLQFPDDSVDVVFTNSLDHALNLGRVFDEIARVLKPGGVFVLEIVPGEKEGYRPREYEAISWQTTEDVLSLLHERGFGVTHRDTFEYPWHGSHIVLQLR